MTNWTPQHKYQKKWIEFSIALLYSKNTILNILYKMKAIGQGMIT